jgi:hypothetical protein
MATARIGKQLGGTILNPTVTICSPSIYEQVHIYLPLQELTLTFKSKK